MIMSPSNVSAQDADYKGPILFNPGMSHLQTIYFIHEACIAGGPNGAGIDFILSEASLFREVLGPQFDLVGFDPRGKLLSAFRHYVP